MKHPLLSLLLFVSFALSACDMLRYHPYQEMSGEPMQLCVDNALSIQQSCAGRDTLRLAFISDTQRHYDDLCDCIDFLNALPDLDFVLIGGDLTDFGTTDEYRWVAADLQRLQRPWLTVIGNHDFLGFGEYNYLHVFGPYNLSVNAGRCHILCLNTIWRDSERGIPSPDFDFLRSDLSDLDSLLFRHPDSLTHTVVVMHNMPGDEQFAPEAAEPFETILRHYPGLRSDDAVFAVADTTALLNTRTRGFCLRGHTHHHELSQPFADSTLYYCVDDIHKREVLFFTLYPDGYEFCSLRF